MAEMTIELTAEIEKLLPIASKKSGVPVEDLRSIVQAVVDAKDWESSPRPLTVQEEGHRVMQMAVDLLATMETEDLNLSEETALELVAVPPNIKEAWQRADEVCIHIARKQPPIGRYGHRVVVAGKRVVLCHACAAVFPARQLA